MATATPFCGFLDAHRFFPAAKFSASFAVRAQRRLEVESDRDTWLTLKAFQHLQERSRIEMTH